jgi:hypothetical protein
MRAGDDVEMIMYAPLSTKDAQLSFDMVAAGDTLRVFYKNATRIFVRLGK